MSSPYSLGFTTLASETSVEALPVRGTVPDWLAGTLARTGPARFEVGDKKYNHWFDGLAMLHGFAFAQGRVSYRNRYLRSRAYQEAMAAGTIRRGEFATDPCRSLFERVASWFSPKLTDSAVEAPTAFSPSNRRPGGNPWWRRYPSTGPRTCTRSA
jgi:beta,beta-carotene 9',10'-dioxygenase